jgi:hypothetical protein
MEKNGAKVENEMSASIDEILKQIDSVEVDNLSIDDKVRLYKKLLKKFGIDSSFNMQTLGGSQMIGNTIQINICDRTAMSDLISTLVDKLGKEAVVEIISIILEKI